MAGWSKSHYGVSHATVNGYWVTTENYGTFTQVGIRSPFTMNAIKSAVFFKNPKPEGSPRKEQTDFWSQGEQHEQNAKEWGERIAQSF